MTELEAEAASSTALKPGFYVLKTDGGIRPGADKSTRIGGIGVVLKDSRYREVDDLSKEIGPVRNHHEAEYRALIEGLQLARRREIQQLRVFLDSALVVNSVNGDWTVKPEDLKQLCSTARALVDEFADIKLCWVPREMNSEADALASRALRRR